MSILNILKRRLKNGGSGKTQAAKAAQADSLLRLLVLLYRSLTPKLTNLF